MVGPYGDWIKHNMDQKTVLVSECDGVRLISAQQHELMSRVPDSLVDIFQIGSTAPGQFYYTPTIFSILKHTAQWLQAPHYVCHSCYAHLSLISS